MADGGEPNGQYWLFAGSTYYPYGGLEDLKGTFDSIELARVEADKCDWWEIAKMGNPAVVVEASPTRDYEWPGVVPVLDGRVDRD